MRSLIFENLMSNINKESNVGFDLTKSIASNQKTTNVQDYDSFNLPIEPKQANWEIIDNHLGRHMYRKYEFKTTKSMIYFLSESLKYAESINHDPTIKIEAKEIEVILTTHDIGDISNLDIKISKFMTEIFNDIQYIG